MVLKIVQDGTAMLWDLAEGKKLYSLEANETIHALCFSPNRYWLCAATDSAIKVRISGNTREGEGRSPAPAQRLYWADEWRKFPPERCG